MAGKLKHGSRALERLLRENALDRRTKTAQQYHALQDALAEDRGGWGNCTAAEKILIERTAALTLVCRTIELFVIKRGILDAAGMLAPVLAKGYTSHAAALTRALVALGLRPDLVERLRDAGTIAAEHTPSDAVPEADDEDTAP